MKESVLIFIDYLKNELQIALEKLNKEYLKTCEKKLKENGPSFDLDNVKVVDSSNPDYIMNIESYKTSLEYMIDECNKRLNSEIIGLEVFSEFEILSELLGSSKLQTKEKFDVLQFFIRENMKNKIFKLKKTFFDMNKLAKCKFKYTTYEEMKNLIDKSELYPFLNKKIIFNNKLKNKQTEMRKYASECSVDHTDRVNAHKEFKKHYMYKESSYEQNDIDKIILALKTLKVSEKICIQIKLMLEKDLKVRKEKDKTYIKELQMKNSVDKFKKYLHFSQNYDIHEITKMVIDEYILKDYSKYLIDYFKKWVTEYLIGDDKEKYFSKEAIDRDFKSLVLPTYFIEPDTNSEIKKIIKTMQDRSRLYVYDYFQRNDLSDYAVKNHLSLINNFLNIINGKDVFKNIFDIFDFYDTLSILLDSSSLKPKEKLFVIIRYTEILYYFSFGKSEKILKMPYLDLNKIRSSYRNLKDNYLDLEETINKENIDNIISSLNELKVSSKVIEEINIYLNSIISKEITDDEEKNSKIHNVQEDIKKKEEENKKLREELKEYFDFDNMRSIRLLSYEEIRKVIEILRQLSVKQEIILEVLRINEKELNNADTLTKLRYLIGRLYYYKEKCSLGKEVEEIEGYYNEICNGKVEDRKEYIEIIEDCLNSVNVYIPKTFEYELNNQKC